jgi:hypothetical protein
VISIFCLLSISVPTTAFEVPPLIGHNNIRRLKLEKLSATKSGDQIPKNEVSVILLRDITNLSMIRQHSAILIILS